MFFLGLFFSETLVCRYNGRSAVVATFCGLIYVLHALHESPRSYFQPIQVVALAPFETHQGI